MKDENKSKVYHIIFVILVFVGEVSLALIVLGILARVTIFAWPYLSHAWTWLVHH